MIEITDSMLSVLREFFGELNQENRTIFNYICDDELSEDESQELKTLLEFKLLDEERTSLTNE